ncbi:MAG: thioredoxin [Gammaproteobacteria bacterium]
MDESPFIFEVTEANYDQLVLEKSREVPVLVDFWAEWCGPCQMQLPILQKLADGYQGKFVIAKIDTDRERGLASSHGIRSIPTMKLFVDGEVVEDILGAQTESTLRMLLERYIARDSDKVRDAAWQAYEQGNADQAMSMLQVAAADDPDNHRLLLDYARIAMATGHLREAETTLASLPFDVRQEPETQALMSLLDFARIVDGAPESEALEKAIAADPDDHQARYQLAARWILEDRHEQALEMLLDLLRRDRSFGDDAARKGMLSVFTLLGDQHPLVSRYRSKMFNALH